MRVFKQRNVFYIDIQKQILSGYVEMDIKREQTEDVLHFKSCCLEIEQIELIGQKNYVLQPKFTAKDEMIDKNSADGFDVIIPKNLKIGNFMLRIIFHKNEINPGMIYYRPVSQYDQHREMLVDCSSYICPYIDQTSDIELVYVIPNNRNLEVLSTGKLVRVSEKTQNLVYVYEAKGVSIKDVRFAIGTYKNQTICEESILCTPSKVQINVDDFVEDVENINRYLSTYVNFVKPVILFTMCDIQEVIGKDMIVLNISHLRSSKDIELNFILKEKMCMLMSEQIFMYFNHAWVDTWIFQGLSGYLSDLTIRYLFGHNEFLYRQYIDKEYVSQNDVIEPPLFYSDRKECEYFSRFFKTKAKMVFHTIHNQLSGAFLKKIIVAVIKIKTKDVISGTNAEQKDLKPPTLNSEESSSGSKKIKVKITSPVSFQKNIKIELQQKKSPKINISQKANAIDNIISSEYVDSSRNDFFTPFFIKIIKDSSGKDMKPFFDFYVFSPGLLKIDISVKVNNKKGIVMVESQQNSTSRIKAANTSYFSFIKIKSVETDGTFNQKIACNTQSSFAIHRKTETGTVLFVRADCKREFFGKITVIQGENLFIEQLLDKNVTGQLEALEYFKNNTSKKAIEALERVAESSTTFYRVKKKIYDILKNVSVKNFSEAKQNYNGTMRLIQFFIKMRCVSNSTVVKNTETGILNFMIQKALVKSITDSPGTDKNNIGVIVSFLNNILNYNDTTKEHFDDPFYLSNILNKLTMHKIGLKNVDEVLLSEIERFRLLDMVFSSPKNIISKTCVVCLLRLAFLNKIKIRIEFLRNLSKYPNYIDLRILALEGLFIFDLENIDFEEYTDSIEMLEGMLKILIRLLELGFKNIKQFLKDKSNQILKYYNLYIGHRLRDLFEIVLGRLTLTEMDYIQQRVFEINYALENKQEISMVVEQAMGGKKIIMVDFEKLKLMVFKKTFKIRLHCSKNEEKEEESEPYEVKFMVTLKYKTYRPVKVFGTTILRLFARGVSLKYRNCDVPFLISQSLRVTKCFTAIEKYLRGLKYTDKYDTEVLPFKRTEDEFTREKLTIAYLSHKQKSSNVNEYFTLRNYIDILYKKSFRFIFLYVPYNSKLYIGCKTMLNAMERCIYQYALIPEKVAIMNELLRQECVAFLESLMKNERYVHFINEVNTHEFKNYLDVVRHSVCLKNILKRLKQVEEVKQVEGGSLNSTSVKYMSFDTFYFELKKVATNALMFNPKVSKIHSDAEILLEEIEFFRSKRTLHEIKGKKMLKELFRQYDTKNFDFDFDWTAIRTWNDLDEELTEIKRKYSRYSANGKLVNENAGKVRKLLEGYFLILNNRVLQTDKF
ncbi:taf2 [Ecytonucleospora hepatopenaei]|uniref:Taf2 n=1 Tax=Ecytonucleospora hepatopenaei TaxID=646526 RepID=A0A1W0E8H4_9MICR|nr:taf2 [Ecytonucleospora hepatopenaei]